MRSHSNRAGIPERKPKGRLVTSGYLMKQHHLFGMMMRIKCTASNTPKCIICGWAEIKRCFSRLYTVLKNIWKGEINLFNSWYPNKYKLKFVISSHHMKLVKLSESSQIIFCAIWFHHSIYHLFILFSSCRFRENFVKSLKQVRRTRKRLKS